MEMRYLCNKDLTEEQIYVLLNYRYYTYISLDIETVSIDKPLPLGIALAVNSDTAFYFLDTQDPLLIEVINNSRCVLFHNASFDLPILRKLGYNVRDYQDTMLKAYSLGILEKSLESLSEKVLHAPYTSVASQWKPKQKENVGIDHVVMGNWSMQHALNTYNLWFKLPTCSLYTDMDRPFIDLIMEMEYHGLLINQYQLTRVEQDAVVKTAQLERELKIELGNINLNSNPQVAAALKSIGVLGTRKTKAGKDSVSDEALKPLKHPVADKLLKYRSIMKTISTYVPALRNIDKVGRLHTEFNYTNTGRLTSSKPNHQNLTRDEKYDN